MDHRGAGGESKRKMFKRRYKNKTFKNPTEIHKISRNAIELGSRSRFQTKKIEPSSGQHCHTTSFHKLEFTLGVVVCYVCLFVCTFVGELKAEINR
jgi:hypothetical protein